MDKNVENVALLYAEEINSLSGTELDNYLDHILTIIAENETLYNQIDEDEIEISLSNDNERIVLLEAIYKEIKDDNDKTIFLNGIIEKESVLGTNIVDYFREINKDLTEENLVEDNLTEESDSSEEVEEIEKEKDLDYDNSDIIEEVIEEQPEEEQEEIEENLEGPAITQYKKETEELRQQLAELEQELASTINEEIINEEDKELEEIISNTTLNEEEKNIEAIEQLDELISRLEEEKALYIRRKDNFINENPNYENFEDLKREYDLHLQAIEKIEQEIKKAQQEKENIKNIPLENENKTVLVKNWQFAKIYDKEVAKLEETLKQLQEIGNSYYEKNMGIPFEIYGMQDSIKALIEKMKKDSLEKWGIRTDLNINAPENRVLIENIQEARKLNADTKKNIDEKYVDKVTEPEQNNDLKEKIEALRSQIGERENNINKYYEALEDIKEIEKEVKAGKTPADEDLKTKIDNINTKISTLPEPLKKELEEYLDKALTMKIDNVKKDPAKWHKWVAGIAGFLAGGLSVALVPGAAAGIVIGSQLIKTGVKLYHKHLKKKEAELAKENVITGIEKPNEKQKGAFAKFKEFMKNEEYVRNINWFLNGATIGAITAGITNKFTTPEVSQGTTEISQSAGTPEAVQAPEAVDPLSEIKIGENVEGFNVTQGHDSAAWAVNNVNSESLISNYVNESSMFQRFAVMNPDGSVAQIINSNGTTIADLVSQGFSPEQIAVDVGKNGISQAWVNVSELTKGIGRSL